MFRKPHKVKSNTQLKSSEKKKIINKVQTHFTIKDDEISLIFPSKEAVSMIKIILNSQESVTVYISQDIPLFFETKEEFLPTIFILWRFPLIIPQIGVYSGVVQHLVNGADLMIPGIIPYQEHLKINDIPAGKPVYICTEKNLAAVCVGVSLIKSYDMIVPGNKGKAVQIYHTFGDELSKMYEFGNKEIPFLKDLFNTNNKEEIYEESIENVTFNQSPDNHTDNSIGHEPGMTMDDLLLYCFIKSMKKYYSQLTLPVLTNIFYKNFMLEVVPKDMTLDIKKTKYKKLSGFLTELNDNKIICLEDIKGVQSIISVNMTHECFKSFIDCYLEVERKIMTDDIPKGMEIIEKSIINSHMESICKKFNHRKGDSLSDQEVRNILTDYIKTENLQDPYSREFVTLNGPLCDILQTKDLRISWKNLFESILKKMSKCYEIRTSDNQVISGKGKLPPIEVTIAVKTSNKKVTLVKNLELYGINLQEFSKECQHGVAASSTVNALPNAKSAVFQVQGNQKKFISKILQEKYFIPKKYLEGLEEQKTKKK